MTEHHPILAEYASDHRQSRGRQIAVPDRDAHDPRSPFQRDRDRIIHCGAFRRLKHKTQVFIYHEGDYFRTRLTHSLEVAQITRAISRQLGIDDDLAEAIALAHDLGHTPFGHAGEYELDAAMQGAGGFDHNEQTVRILTSLEHCYAEFDGLNLTWETLEGVIKHNGPIDPEAIRPTVMELDAGMNFGLDTYASLEAQVAALSDDIAYLAHDCDDGIRAGLLDPELMLDLPLAGPVLADLKKRYGRLETSRLVHELTRRLISDAVTDLVRETRRRLDEIAPKSADDIRGAGMPVAAFSPSMATDLDTLKSFLFRAVWRHYKVNRMTSKARRVTRQLFDLFMAQPNVLPGDWQQIDGRALADLPEEQKARQIADYIASMTDRYAMMEYERLFDLGPILR
ncbi:deoxyguanosinetriphosphate triphosphohydrolase [Alphaproteobacteria bacterium LSUCC0684]